MFCPNCGNNCGDAKFCSECGTKLTRDTEQSEQNVLKSSPSKNEKIVNIPTTLGFSGQSGVIAFYDSAVSVTTGGLNAKKRILIPFDQITAVVYLRPTTWKIGVLLLRGEGNKNVPIPDIRYMNLDAAAVTFNEDPDNVFYHIFYVLKAVAPLTAKFELIIPESKIKNLDQISSDIDMDHYWNECAPERNRAIEKIKDQHAINKKIATAIVDRYFDARQKIRYETDPLNAIRDLNVFVDKKKNISRIQGELKEIQRQDRIERSLWHVGSMMWDDK